MVAAWTVGASFQYAGFPRLGHAALAVFLLELGGLCLLLGILSRAAWTMQEIDRVTTD